MSPQLSTLLQQADELPIEEQLTLLSHLEQKVEAAKVKKNEATSDASNKSPSPKNKSVRQILDEFSADLPEEAFNQVAYG